jgi:hypothetical protein
VEGVTMVVAHKEQRAPQCARRQLRTLRTK